MEEAIPILDWEDKDAGDVGWAYQWLQIVEKAYGCKPWIYMSEYIENSLTGRKLRMQAMDYGLRNIEIM